MKKHGGLANLAAKQFGECGMPEAPWKLARRGDVAFGDFANGANGGTLGVVAGAEVAAPGRHGAVFSPLEKTIKAWRAG